MNKPAFSICRLVIMLLIAVTFAGCGGKSPAEARAEIQKDFADAKIEGTTLIVPYLGLTAVFPKDWKLTSEQDFATSEEGKKRLKLKESHADAEKNDHSKRLLVAFRDFGIAAMFQPKSNIVVSVEHDLGRGVGVSQYIKHSTKNMKDSLSSQSPKITFTDAKQGRDIGGKKCEFFDVTYQLPKIALPVRQRMKIVKVKNYYVVFVLSATNEQDITAMDDLVTGFSL